MVVRRACPMDGRGRELQQVETGSRFWWRALDAHTPDPAASAAQGFANWHYPSSTAAHARNPSPRSGFTLQIHRSQRRSRRNAAKRWRQALVALSILPVMCAAGAIAAFAPRVDAAGITTAMSARTTQALIGLGFGIDQVSVTGQRYVNDSDVFDALDLPNVPTFAAFDADAALKRIERIPWVDTAQITRAFPGSLRIEIRERVPAAIWSRGDKTYLIDATGRVLGPVPATNGWVLPQVAGEGANTEVMMLLTALDRHKDVEAQFDHAERISERRWSVVLKNGSRFELGADREVEGLDQIAENSDLSRARAAGPVVIDVRTPGRIAVRPLHTQTLTRQASASAVLARRP